MLGASSRVINLSSAAQAPVNLRALGGEVPLSDNAAYAQSKLALTMWSHALALSSAKTARSVVAVNPGSMLGTKMVRKPSGFQAATSNRRRHPPAGALSDEFATASGKYFDNDAGRFARLTPMR